ncbi:MAG: hypothetical protein ABIJ08_02480 [Nanoarchaeota archaeon]
MNIPCLKCKGSNPMKNCGRTFCPITAKANAGIRVKNSLPSDNFSGSSPAPFVGHNSYPNLNVGILSPPEQREDAWLYDAPNYWAAKEFQIPQIIDYRSALINSRFKMNVRQTSKMLEVAQEVGLASKPVDVEISLEDRPYFKLNTDSYLAPTGPNARLKQVNVTSNPKIEYKVEKVFSDSDLKANDAINYLYNHGFSENFLTKILSVGTIGMKKDRKLVPTRWSITATDDMIAKDLNKKIKDYPSSDYKVYFGNYLGNYFIVLLMPDVWSYELFETYAPKAEWNVSSDYKYMTDYEGYDGRKTYASNCGGGYYASRLPIIERLHDMKRQAAVLVLRFITGEYAVPLGVWVVREAVRKTMNTRPLEFGSKDLMLKYVRELVRKKFNYNVENLLKESILLKNLRVQQKLTNFI